MLRRIVRRYGLSPAQVDDAVQQTWMRLCESSGSLRRPAAVAGWLITTARREALRVLQGPVSELLSADSELGDRPETDDPERLLLAGEARTALIAAIGRLSERQRGLMSLLLIDPAMEYREIRAVTGMPTGSIGPTRARCLDRLAADPWLRSLNAERA